MKVSIGIALKSAPWGGGNQFGVSLAEFLRTKGVIVSHDLSSVDLDIILLMDPRAKSSSATFSDIDIVKYLLKVNKNALVVHRVNECDERKNTKNVNPRLRLANIVADYTVFVSSWLRDLHKKQGMIASPNQVILNGANKKIFDSNNYIPWNEKDVLRIVTHHWSNNWLKGFDIYEKLDKLIEKPKYKEKISFEYIGNLPQNFMFNNSFYTKPLWGKELADKLSKNHVYLTASKNEPGGNHQNEGAACGLPLLYRESGCMPEYCSGFGLSFNDENFELQLDEMMLTYSSWRKKMVDFPLSAEKTSRSYYNLFSEMLEKRDELLALRKKRRILNWFYRYLSNGITKLMW